MNPNNCPFLIAYKFTSKQIEAVNWCIFSQKWLYFYLKIVVFIVENGYIFSGTLLYFWSKMVIFLVENFFLGELYKILGKNVYILVSYILGLIYLWW